jgi:hypothetical protein
MPKMPKKHLDSSWIPPHVHTDDDFNKKRRATGKQEPMQLLHQSWNDHDGHSFVVVNAKKKASYIVKIRVCLLI